MKSLFHIWDIYSDQRNSHKGKYRIPISKLQLGKKCDSQRVRSGTRAGSDSKLTLLKRKGRVRPDHSSVPWLSLMAQEHL